MHYIILYNILYKINNFLIAKIKAILLLIKLISKKNCLYIDAFDKQDLTLDKKNLATINKAIEMSGRSKYIKMPDVRYISLKSKYNTFN